MIKDHIPDKIRNDIGQYLKDKCKNHQKAAGVGINLVKIVLTASFFQSIAHESEIDTIGHDKWKWKIEYSTIGGQGPGSLESYIGTDVILFIEVLLPNNKIYRKGILIQSKITSKIIRKTLENQINEIEVYVPNSSVVLGYGENDFKSVTGNKYRNQKRKIWDTYATPFGNFLSDEFLECKYGIEDLYYDFDKNEVVFHDKINNKLHIAPQKGVSSIQIKKTIREKKE